MDNNIEIYKKLFAIQQLAVTVKESGKNPHFKSSYAPLEDIITNFQPYWKEHKLLVTHYVENNYLVTQVLDVDSGQSVKSDFPISDSILTNPQKVGGAMTYGKRYNLCAIFNIVTTEDDDGNIATGRPKMSTKMPKVDKIVNTSKYMLSFNNSTKNWIKPGQVNGMVKAIKSGDSEALKDVINKMPTYAASNENYNKVVSALNESYPK